MGRTGRRVSDDQEGAALVSAVAPPFPDNAENELQHALDIVPHGRRPQSDHPDALLTQPRRPSPVALYLARIIMRRPIDLDGQPRRRAIEVENERPDRVLSSEAIPS